MTKSIRCSDVGVECDWKAAAPTEGELMVMVENHAKQHGYYELPQEILLKVKSAIKDI
jgi:predicted small metal-binding protein